MIQFTTFGGPVLRDVAGQPIESILAQPRRLALLTYLALETRKVPVRRDVVLAMFWPEVSQARASRALSQAMFFLRKALGSDVLSEPGREDLRVNSERLACDAVAFLTAVESGRHKEAVSLFAGDFLRGFYIDNSPEFEQWLEEQRLYMRRLAAESALAEARRAASDRQAMVAATYARRAAELGLFAEPMIREQMELLDSVGDTAGALEAYEQLRRRLRREMESDPAPETKAVAERLRKRFTPPTAIPITTSPQPADVVTSARLPARTRRRSLVVAVVAVVAFGATVSFWGLSRPGHLDGEQIPVLLIDDFIEAGTAPTGSGIALTRAVVSKLSSVSGLSAKHVKAAPLAATSAADANPLVLRAYVSSAPWQKGVQVSVRLINGLTGEGIAYGDFTYHEASDRTVGEIADFVRIEAGRYSRTERLADLSPRNAEAIRKASTLGVLGDSLRGEGEVEPALTAFAAADSMLAATAGGQRTAAKTLAARADLWLGRAWVFVTPLAFDVGAFRNAARRAVILADSALDLDKRSARALEVKGFAAHLLWQFLPADSVAALRRFVDMSEATLRTAVDIAPARARSWALLAAILYVKGQYDDALEAAQRAYTANAFLEQSSDVLHRLYSSALETGDAKTATTWCQEITRRFADSWMDADCRLQVLAWSKPTQDQFKTASLLVARQKARHAQPDQLVARLEMVLGVVGARAGLPVDSALAIQNHALAASPHDPELAPVRAWLWRAVDRPDSVHAVMSAYVGADPIRRAGLMKSRRFRIDGPMIAVNQSLQ